MRRCSRTAICSRSAWPMRSRGWCGVPRVGGAYQATSANEAAGAGSRYAGLLAAAAVLLLLALFLRWIERIPEPVLAAIVIHAVSKSLRLGVFANYFRWQRDRQGAPVGGRAGVGV